MDGCRDRLRLYSANPNASTTDAHDRRPIGSVRDPPLLPALGITCSVAIGAGRVDMRLRAAKGTASHQLHLAAALRSALFFAIDR